MNKKKSSGIVKKVPKKSSVYQYEQPKLTKTEKEIITYLTKDFLTIKQIANRRRTSQRAVRKTIQNLREKGIINRNYKIVPKNVCPPELFQKNGTFPIRLHGLEFNVKILFKDERYKNILSKGNTIFLDGNTIRLFKQSIEVYVVKSFYADNPHKCMSKALKYVQRLFIMLENDAKIILLKNRSYNIRVVKAEFAEVGNEFAVDCYDKSDKIKVYTREDGKLWFLIDNSFNLHEAETVHSETSQYDMQNVVQPFFNDLRTNKPPINSELAIKINEILEIQKITQNQINTLLGFYVPKDVKDQKNLNSYIG